MSLDKLLKQAKFVDTVDAITGPLSAFAYSTGSEPLMQIGTVLSTIELAIKIPFAINYMRKTKDSKALLYWGVKEVFSNFNPQMGYIDIIPMYSMRVKYKLSCE